jgi:hypothetical protein
VPPAASPDWKRTRSRGTRFGAGLAIAVRKQKL